MIEDQPLKINHYSHCHVSAEFQGNKMKQKSLFSTMNRILNALKIKYQFSGVLTAGQKLLLNTSHCLRLK